MSKSLSEELDYIADCAKSLHVLIEAEFSLASLDDQDRLLISRARGISEELAAFSRSLEAAAKRHALN